MNATWWSPTAEGLQLTVRVTTGGRRSEVIGVRNDALRIRVAARPVDDQANDELRRFVAEVFGVRRSAVRLTHGRRSRTKTVALIGPTAPPRRLLMRLGGAT